MVYPERAINEALRTLKKGGKLILVFPDFVATEHLPSQQMGFSPGSTREKIKKGRYLDALVTLFDSRVRLKPTIRKASNQIGPFPVNLNPVCLNTSSYMSPDIDATYIASKKEVHDWAVNRGLQAEYPSGIEGQFLLHSFVVITK